MESQQLFSLHWLKNSLVIHSANLKKVSQFKKKIQKYWTSLRPIKWPWTRRIFCTALSYLSLMRAAGIETKNKSCQFFFKIFATYFFGWKSGNFWIWFLLISKVWTISSNSLTERVDQINNKNSIQTKLETFALNSSKAIKFKQPG